MEPVTEVLFRSWSFFKKRFFDNFSNTSSTKVNKDRFKITVITPETCCSNTMIN